MCNELENKQIIPYELYTKNSHKSMNNRTIQYPTILFLFISILFLTSCKTEKKSHPSLGEIDFSNKQVYKFINVGDRVQMAYLDLGNIDDPVVLLLHGEPSSAFLYRNIAPQIAAQGFRVVVPDLIGFGFSDKPKNPDLITYSNHTEWLTNFIDGMELKEINLFAHDWGGMIGLRIVAQHPEKFKKVAVSYAYLFEGTEEIPESFIGFKNYAQNDPGFSAGNIVNWGSIKKIPDSIKAIYDRYYTSTTDYNTIRKFPSMIPTQLNDPEAILNRELNKKLRSFKNPFITIWGNHEDLMWKGKDIILQESVLGAKNRTHYLLESSHFIQEDQPEELRNILIRFFSFN